jgi:S1-C subfamily serine protease
VGFAVPVNTAKRIVPQLIQFGEVKRPRPGASFYTVEDFTERGFRMPVESGLIPYNVVPNGTLQKVGIKGLSRDGYGEIVLGDIIISIDGVKMSNTDDLFRYLDKKQIGDTVQVEIYRGNSRTTVPVKLLQSSQTTQTRPNRRF